jgi:hypothetical protein
MSEKTGTLNGIVFTSTIPITTYCDKIYILNNPLITTLNNVLLTASAITNNFAHSAHTHAISDITSGSLPIVRGGTGLSSTSANAILVGTATNSAN